MISASSGANRSMNNRRRSTRAGSTASSLKTGITMLSSGPPIGCQKLAPSVTESGRKPAGIVAHTLGALLDPQSVHSGVHPQVYDSSCEPIGIRAVITGPEEIVYRPIQIRHVKTIAANSFAELNKLFWKVDQQRIAPANAALLPSADQIPVSVSQDLIVFLCVASAVLYRLM